MTGEARRNAGDPQPHRGGGHTAAGTSLPAAATEAGTSIATPAVSRKRPRASLVPPGGRSRVTSAIESHVPDRIPIPVPRRRPAQEAEDRRRDPGAGPRTRGGSGRRLALGRCRANPAAAPASSSVPTASARNPSGSGSRSDAGRPCRGRSRPPHATTSAWGAACFIRVRSHRAGSPSRPRTLRRRSSSSSSRDALRGLADERPADVALAGHQVEVVEVAQQAEAALRGRGRARSAAAPARRRPPRRSARRTGARRSAWPSHCAASSWQMSTTSVSSPCASADLAEGRRASSRLRFGAAGRGSGRAACQLRPHPARPGPRPTLNSGCLETGSQRGDGQLVGRRGEPSPGPAAPRSQ